MSISFKRIVLPFLFSFFVVSIAQSQSVWKNNNFELSLKDKGLEVYYNQKKIVEIISFQFNFIQPVSMEIEESKRDTLKLKLIFTEKDGFRRDFPSQIILTINQFENTLHFYTNHPTFNHITILVKDQNEHYFGLIEKLYPHNSKNPDLHGNTIDVEVYGNGNRDYAENYASAYSAFYMSNLGYGSFFDSFAKGRYQFAINGVTEIYHQTRSLDWYLFLGSNGSEIHRQYYQIIGKPKYIPIWACGPIFWRDQNDGGKDELLNDIANFSKLKIPLTACWIDRPYSHGGNEWSKMDFTEKFSGPEEWIKTINEKYGMQVMTWVGPLTFSDLDFPGLLPNYKTYIDLSNPEAIEEFENRLKKHQYSVNIRGHKMDRADENFPFTAHWNQPVSESESRNKYVYLYAKVIDGFLTRAYGKNHFNFARAAFHRCQPYLNGVWGGDSRSNWQGMAGNQANAIRTSYLGFPVWGSDTGGYLGEGRIGENLYIRWLQWSVWNGMFEIKIDGSGGSGEDRPPWKYSEQLQKVFKDVCDLRMSLLPYIYSCANTSYSEGVLMKPLAYMYPGDQNTFEIWDEFIFGNVFLVAPIFTPESNREIYLPQGTWYDFNNPEKILEGPISLKEEIPLDITPVFIKGNSIYLTGNIFQGNSKLWQKELQGNEEMTIHLYPGEMNETVEFKYLDYFDNDKEKLMKMSCKKNQVTFVSEPLKISTTIEIRSDKQPEKIFLNGESIDYDYNFRLKIAKIFAEKDKATELILNY